MLCVFILKYLRAFLCRFIQPPNCQQLIHKLKEANDDETVEILKGIQTWHFGKVSSRSRLAVNIP